MLWVGWGCRNGLIGPLGPGPLHPRLWELPKEAALGLLAAWTGVWSVVGDLYCEKLRTLSTNWNLKFQRGEPEGPYPRVEMAWLLSPTTFVLCLDKSLTPSPLAPQWQVGEETRDSRVVSTHGK